ncbi:amino acid adenylation domain-containing protein [Sphaerisporangium aureirubrum]|uniref:Amino acid adenylation domain-containing protein n=1 Tax=Sphaerisporangium aureirubrum TaxID=1544736 RepID=A0ABW1NU02_9ACTN
MTDLQSRIAALSPEQRTILERRLAELTAARGSAPDERIAPRDPARPIPLAFQQEREWAITQFRPANNIPGAFRVEGHLDLTVLGRVLTEVVDRHEILRSTVELQDDGTRVLMVHPRTPVPTPLVDLSDHTPELQRAEVLRRWKAEVMLPFGRDQSLRLRTTILRMAEDDHVVLITTDHTAADLVSMAILVREFAALYVTHLNGGPGLPPLEIQYADFAAWQREFGEKRMADEVDHWRRTLEGTSGVLTLPSDRPFPPRPTFAGAAHVVDLSAEFTAELRRFIENEKASPVVVLLAALSVLLYRYLGREDLVIGEIVSGRGRVEVEQLIGCFVTALPLRMRLSDGQTLREVVEQAQRTVHTAYDHQDLPIERLIDELNLGREASQTSMTHMWLDVRTPESTLEVPGLRISREPIEVNMSAAPLTLDANPNGERMQLQWVHMTDMFDMETIVLLAEQFNTVLRQFVTAPGTTVGEVELAMTTATEAPDTEAGAADPGFVELFQRRVTLAPHAPAVICDGTPTSYAELNREANLLARRLRGLGVGRDTPVGILVDRSVRLPVAILGVLKAGGVYVPLDPAYPPERISMMLADSGARVLVTQKRLADVLAEAGVQVPDQAVLLDASFPPPDAGEDGDLPDVPDPASLAYVVYTSGSTGRPKGAMIEHRSLSVYARDVVDRLGLGAGDRFLQFSSPGFDVLVEELFPTWLAGGAVVIPSRHIISGEVDLVDLIERERLTVMELPAAYWHEWVRELDRLGRELPSCLRLVIIGAERALPDRLLMWRRLNVPLMNCYGLTETTVTSTFFRLDPADPVWDWPNMPIGTALPSADLRVLDDRLRPVPVGGTGEMYIGGSSLARGYLARPGLTAQRFVADPDPRRPGRRLYRTGDLVRRRPDGNLEFLGRVDTQIKIRGFRVEPMEIESMLSRHPQIAESVVVVYEPSPGDRRLAAYLVPGPGARAGIPELRRFLERELPAYMVPSAFVELEALPLNANGKIDRDRLPAPDGLLPDSGEEYVEPQTPVQHKLADVMAGVVGLGRVGIHDNFFEIGGDSILAIQVVARAQEAGLRLSPYDLFTNPTVASLAEVAAAGPTVDAEQGDVTGPVPLAPAQRWFCASGAEEPHHWNASVLLELRQPADARLVGEAVEHLLGHHDGLRMRLLLAGERTRVRIAPRGDVTPLRAYDLSGLDEDAQDRRMAELADEVQRGLDLAVGPLVRAGLFLLGGRRPDRLALVAHRLVVDPASMRVLLDDLGTALTQLASGREVKLPAKTTSWQSWVRRLTAYGATEPVRSQRGYWSELVTAPAGELPFDIPAEPAAGTVAAARTVEVSLSAAETAELTRTASDVLSCRTEELLLTALGRTLTGWTGAGRHLVDLERHGREPLAEDVDLSRTVGRFSVVHPVALTCEPDASLETTLKTVKEGLRSVPSGGIGWLLLRQGREPMPETAAGLGFSYLGETDPPASAAFTVLPEQAGADESPRARRPYPIEVRASVAGGALVVQWRYSESLHHRHTMERLAESHLGELRALVGLGRHVTSAYTPSDFPLARVNQEQLNDLLNQL